MADRLSISVVVPVYNEREVLDPFFDRLTTVLNDLPYSFEILFVNDGSTDETREIILGFRKRDPRVALINLSRNFGKEIAMTAGLDHVESDATILIDADLQHPPEVIPDLIRMWEEGYDIVYAKRLSRPGESWLRKSTAGMFYRVMRRVGERVQIPADAVDFRLMNQRSLNALRSMREQHRFMKGLFAWVGFRQAAVPFHAAERPAGSSKWSYWNLWNFSIEGITSFTIAPLKISTYIGLMIALLAFVYAAVIIYKTIVFGDPVAGFPSLMTVVLFLGGVQLAAIGLLGEYLGRIFNETKARPLYFVQDHLPAENLPVARPVPDDRETQNST